VSAELLASKNIPPHEDRRIVIGEYESKALVPRLDISFKSKGRVFKDDVRWIESCPVTEDGSVRQVVYVQNYSAHDVTVNVRQDERGR
jgi:hypothetical protein